MLNTGRLLSEFITLFVTIGPIDTAAVFLGVTSGVHRPHRRGLAVKAVIVAGVVLMIFTVGGVILLDLLHISLPAFRVAGGLLLFLQAVTLVFSNPGLSSLSASEKRDARLPGDIAVFPLAFPLIAGPGSLSAVVLLTASANGMPDEIALVAILVICLALTLAALLGADWLGHRLGRTGADVVSRISGMLLAALAVQFVFDGLSGTQFLHQR